MDEIKAPAKLRPPQLVNLARRLLSTGGSLQSTSAVETISRDALVDALSAMLRHELPISIGRESLTPENLAASTADDVMRAMTRVAGGTAASNLSDSEYAALEVVVQAIGRPAMPFNNGAVAMPPDLGGENERWRVLIALCREKINSVSASVGRIASGENGDGILHGTGWRLGTDLIVTNRHVLRDFVENPSDSSPAWRLDTQTKPRIQFAPPDEQGRTEAFQIVGIAYCAPEKPNDFAVLILNDTRHRLPPGLPVDMCPESAGRFVGPEGSQSFQGAEIYVVGHPYRAWTFGESAAVFGVADGAKRWSPGQVIGVDDTAGTMSHDCSTLAGNSGSCVVGARTHHVVGLHMGGLNMNELTGRGTSNVALDFGRLQTPRIGTILKNGKV